MPKDVNPPRRAYSSPVRADQARLTRDRILRAARELFLTNGFTRTTITAVATTAEVSAETVYATFGGKQGLLQAVIEGAILGETPPARRADWVGNVLALPDPRERLHAWVGHTCAHLGETSAVHAMIRGAADNEPFAAELRARLLRERLSLHTLRCQLFLHGHLRDGLTVDQAAQRYHALLSPELHHLITHDLHWPANQYREWVSALLDHDLMPPRPR